MDWVAGLGSACPGSFPHPWRCPARAAACCSPAPPFPRPGGSSPPSRGRAPPSARAAGSARCLRRGAPASSLGGLHACVREGNSDSESLVIVMSFDVYRFEVFFLKNT